LKWVSVGVEDLLGIHEVIDMVAHRHEQVEEDFPPVDAVSQVLTIYSRAARGAEFISSNVCTYPISISICMVPLRLNVFRERIIRAR
jgi:hypothetical protein